MIQGENMANHPDKIKVRIAETASDALEVPIEDLPPLSDVINLDALESLIRSTTTNRSSLLTVTFSYAGLWIFVCSGNTVYVKRISDENEKPTVDFAARNAKF